jgi:hypothetical protein
LSRLRLLRHCAIGAALLWAPLASVAAAEEHSGAGRIEARSNDLLAVGLVHGDKMTLHLSRTIDNSPVRDAHVTVILRGAGHPATAETDGSYSLQTPDLALSGAAAVEFQITEGQSNESLKGTLDVAGAASKPQDSNNARQLWWWVLNFAVCIGFLWLFSRRKSASQD